MERDTLLEVLNQVDRLARTKKHSIGRELMFPREVQASPDRFLLSVEPTPVRFDIDGLENTTLAAVAIRGNVNPTVH